MADRLRRERQAKPDKFAALKLARQGGGRDWKVRGSGIRVDLGRSDAANFSFYNIRERTQSYMMRSQRINTRASFEVV
jgi:hypothetical protein